MKALSFLQPWPYAIQYLGKSLDNRSRKDGKRPNVCAHRGPLLVHVSAGMGVTRSIPKGAPEDFSRQSYFDWSIEWMMDRGLWKSPESIGAKGLLREQAFPRGGISGRVNVVAHCDPQKRLWYEADESEQEMWEEDEEERTPLDWHMEGSWGLVIENFEPLPFIPYKGAQGLFNVPDELIESTLAARGPAR